MSLFGKMFVFLLIFVLNISAVNSELGRVEWTKNGPIVYSKGIGAINPQMPMAVQRPAVIEAAKVVGLRNVLEIIKGININSETTVENHMLSDDIIVKSAQGKIKNYEVGEPHYYSDGTVEVEIKVYLYQNKELMKDLLPMKDIGKKDLKKSSKSSDAYTGIIVDCSDFTLLPALTVNVKDESGDELYSPSIAKEDYIFQMEGMVAYTSTVEQAKELSDRVGKNPIVVSALKVVGENSTDVVISSKDLNKILGNKKNISALQECRVIFVSKNF